MGKAESAVGSVGCIVPLRSGQSLLIVEGRGGLTLALWIRILGDNDNDGRDGVCVVCIIYVIGERKDRDDVVDDCLSRHGSREPRKRSQGEGRTG